MAAPSYTTDLTDIVTDPPSSTGWTLISSGGGGANSFTAPETDDYIQSAGTDGCISRNPFSSSIRGMVYNSSQTIPAGDALFIWTKSDVAQALGTKANGGIQALIGSGTGALNCYYVSGSDDAFGGWKCFPIDPRTGVVTPSTTIGSPTTTLAYWGVRWNVPASGPSKGFPFKIDAIRYGRSLIVTDGDVGNGYATFLGAANFQGDITRQWGLFQFQNGVYTQQGLFQFGASGTAVDFRDSNRVIFVANTEFVDSTFNGFEVINASSRVDLTNISITALGTTSKGYFDVVDNADVNIDGCTFVDMDAFTFQTNSSVLNSVFRRCGLITPGGAVFNDNTIAASPATIAVTSAASNLSNLQRNTFVSTGTGHGLEITGSAGSYTLVGNQFSGYAASNGSTGNEAVYVNISTGTVTLNITSGGSTPSIRTAGATVVVNSNVSVTLTGLKNPTEVRVFEAGTQTEVPGTGNENVTTGSHTFSIPSGTAVDISVLALTYQNTRILNFSTTVDATIPVSQVLDRQYENP